MFKRVGNIEINSFFDDAGVQTSVPKFIKLLQEEDLIDQSSAKKELSSLFSFAQEYAEKLRLGLDIDRKTPDLESYNKARENLMGSGGLNIFDNFTVKLSTNISNDGLPTAVTDDMIDEVRQARNRRKGEKVKDTYNLYDTYMKALIEKKLFQ